MTQTMQSESRIDKDGKFCANALPYSSRELFKFQLRVVYLRKFPATKLKLKYYLSKIPEAKW